MQSIYCAFNQKATRCNNNTNNFFFKCNSDVCVCCLSSRKHTKNEVWPREEVWHYDHVKTYNARPREVHYYYVEIFIKGSVPISAGKHLRAVISKQEKNDVHSRYHFSNNATKIIRLFVFKSHIIKACTASSICETNVVKLLRFRKLLLLWKDENTISIS